MVACRTTTGLAQTSQLSMKLQEWTRSRYGTGPRVDGFLSVAGIPADALRKPCAAGAVAGIGAASAAGGNERGGDSGNAEYHVEKRNPLRLAGELPADWFDYCLCTLVP